MWSSKNAFILRLPTGSSPSQPMRFSSSPKRLPLASTRSFAQSSSWTPAKTPEASMAGAKRVPSSFVQLVTTIGCFVLMFRSFSVRTSSSAPRTPSTPSYLPPVGWVSRWLPT